MLWLCSHFPVVTSKTERTHPGVFIIKLPFQGFWEAFPTRSGENPPLLLRHQVSSGSAGSCRLDLIWEDRGPTLALKRTFWPFFFFFHTITQVIAEVCEAYRSLTLFPHPLCFHHVLADQRRCPRWSYEWRSSLKGSWQRYVIKPHHSSLDIHVSLTTLKIPPFFGFVFLWRPLN